MRVKLFDTTLRDGSQSTGVSFSVNDKLKIASELASFGIDYIEGGWPGSNPTDEEFFSVACRIPKLKTRLVAFGSTRYKNTRAETDPNLKAIIKSGVKTSSIFGKTWDLHVIHALRTTLDENLKMIYDSIKFLRSKGIPVIYDAEHFFDGFKANKDYAIATLEKAVEAGAFNISLCDTNGGTLPGELVEIIQTVKKKLSLNSKLPARRMAGGSTLNCSLGIHAHNDSECGVANSVVAVECGVKIVQGTINGIGERCGNANLVSIIPALKLKLGYTCVSSAKLKKLTELSRYVDEVINKISAETQPYVGRNAFAHKGGIHVSAVERHSKTYEHIDPSLVGNSRRIVISELAGKSNILAKVKELKFNIARTEDAVKKIIDAVKKNEANGYQYEDADGSFAVLVLKVLGKYMPLFELKSYRTIVEKDKTGRMITEATIKIEVNGKMRYTVAEGDGPVNALDRALHKSLEEFYPQLKKVDLRDFRVRVINPTSGTAAAVRVFIESTDGKNTWGSVGISENIIEASWQALSDALEYKLLRIKLKD